MQIPSFEYLGEGQVEEQIAASKAAFDEYGCVIFPRVLSAEFLGNLAQGLAPYLDGDVRGRNDFEGVESNRVYALLAKHEVFSELATHPLALGYAEAEFGPSVLLSAMLAIRLLPGETTQPWHTDDGHIDIAVLVKIYRLNRAYIIERSGDELREVAGTVVLPPRNLVIDLRHGHDVEITITVDIDHIQIPDRIGGHAAGRDRHLGKILGTVVLVPGQRLVAGVTERADDDIDVAVTVEIAGADCGGTGDRARQSVGGERRR